MEFAKLQPEIEPVPEPEPGPKVIEMMRIRRMRMRMGMKIVLEGESAGKRVENAPMPPSHVMSFGLLWL